MNRHARQLFYFGWGNLAPVFNPMAQAVAILTKYGGSLWVADPRYTFTGSDGTGAASDGSDAGYVRDLCGNARPLTQPTTSFKPKLRLLAGRWAWVFDGVDDYLASVSSDISNAPDYTLITAFASENRSGYRIALGVFAGGGQDHMALLGEFLDTPFLSQYSRDINGPAYAGGGGVVSGLSSSAGRRLRANGADVASAAYAPLVTEARAIRMGFGVGGDYLKGRIFAAAYIPGTPTDAEMLIIERAMGQVGGIAI